MQNSNFTVTMISLLMKVFGKVSAHNNMMVTKSKAFVKYPGIIYAVKHKLVLLLIESVQ